MTAWSFICKRFMSTVEDLVKEWVPEVMAMFAKAPPATSGKFTFGPSRDSKSSVPDISFSVCNCRYDS